MNCPNCGTYLNEGTRFCIKCGTPVSAGNPQYQNPQQNQAQYQNPQYQNQQYGAPQYQNPQYHAPQYQNPQYQNPQYQNPQYQNPQYQNPQYQNPQYYNMPYGNNAFNPGTVPLSQRNLTEKDFFNQYATKGAKNLMTANGVVCFVTAAVSIVLIAVLGNMYSIVDLILYFILGILTFSTKNWVCPLLVAITGGAGTVIGLVNTGTLSGVPALIIAIGAASNAKLVHDAYLRYKNEGIIPSAPVGK